MQLALGFGANENAACPLQASGVQIGMSDGLADQLKT